MVAGISIGASRWISVGRSVRSDESRSRYSRSRDESPSINSTSARLHRRSINGRRSSELALPSEAGRAGRAQVPSRQASYDGERGIPVGQEGSEQTVKLGRVPRVIDQQPGQPGRIVPGKLL